MRLYSDCAASGRVRSSQATQSSLQFGVHNGFRTFESAPGGFDFLTGNFRAALVGLKFLQPRHDNLCKVALLVTVRDLDCFVQLTFPKSTRDSRIIGCTKITSYSSSKYHLFSTNR